MQNRPMKSATALTSQPWWRLNVRLPLWALGLQKEKPETDKPEFLRIFDDSSQQPSNHRRRKPQLPALALRTLPSGHKSPFQPALPPCVC